jgi:hypothetical protein
MSDPEGNAPVLLNAASLAEADVGSCTWDPDLNSALLSVSEDGLTVEWGPKKPEYEAKFYPPAWVPASTRMRLHSGTFRWDFVVEEMAKAQIGLGFMLLWNLGVDWGFFGYLGASPTAWAYDPSTGDVVCNTQSIEGGLPKFKNRRRGVVSVQLHLPRQDEGSGCFVVNDVKSRPIRLPVGAVILPAACLLKESQRVTLSRYERS